MSKKITSITIEREAREDLFDGIENISKKEKKSITEVFFDLLNIGYQEYTNKPPGFAQPMSVVSLFAGAGGMDVGLQMNGFKTIWANEIDGDSCKTFKANHPAVHVEQKDIRDVRRFPLADLVVGGYPCQGFSLAGNRLITDERNFLYREFVRVLRDIHPKFFIAENVKGLLTIGQGGIIKAMVNDFESQGYKVSYYLVNAKNYGVPQDRERVFIIGVRRDIAKKFEYQLPNITHSDDPAIGTPYITLRDTIGHLKQDEIGEFYDGGFSSRFLSRNRQRGWDEVSFTIQANGRHVPLHPSGEPMRKISHDKWIVPGTTKHRRLSTKECALIQTFPADYVWHGTTASVYKQIGNAAPCLLVKVISEPIAEFLLKERDISLVD